MNQQAVGLIQANRLKRTHQATRILALANMAAFDANIACWDAEVYLLAHSASQADPAITLPIGLPNHPSYTSGHSVQHGDHTPRCCRTSSPVMPRGFRRWW